MTKQSAGILLFRRISDHPIEIFLVHPGGPFWKSRDEGAWSIPKGEFAEDEVPLDAARREFQEETGISVSGEFIPLLPVILKGGKKVFAWAIEKDIDETKITSNLFEMEWPPRSGRLQSFPEIDKGKWFTLEAARQKINIRQVGLLDELAGILGEPS